MHYRECLKVNQQIEEQLEKGYFSQFWISYQRRKAGDVTANRIRTFNKTMSRWIDKATKSGTQIYVVGVSGTHWNETPYQEMVNDKMLTASNHRLPFWIQD